MRASLETSRVGVQYMSKFTGVCLYETSLSELKGWFCAFKIKKLALVARNMACDSLLMIAASEVGARKQAHLSHRIHHGKSQAKARPGSERSKGAGDMQIGMLLGRAVF